MKIKLKQIDLSKCCQKKGGHGQHWHPNINSKSEYLALIDGEFFAGRFTNEWYGWSFDGWGGGGGLQLDKPGTNASDWQGLWEIIKGKRVQPRTKRAKA